MVTISAETTLKGELKSRGHIRIEGRVEGDGDIDGLLRLSRKGYWKGTLAADIVIVEGTVDGDIKARSKLEVHANARITGNIYSPSILIRKGGRVTGQLFMNVKLPIPLIEDKNEQHHLLGSPISAQVRRVAGE